MNEAEIMRTSEYWYMNKSVSMQDLDHTMLVDKHINANSMGKQQQGLDHGGSTLFNFCTRPF